jgi:hypothetical protein
MAGRKPITPRLLEELQEDPELRQKFLQTFGDELVTKLQLLEQARVLERHTAAIEHLVTAVYSQGQRLEEHSKRLEDLTGAVREQGKRLEDLTRVVGEHSQRLAEHSQRLEELTRAVGEQNKRLEEHSQRLAEHSKRLEEHSRRLEELTAAVREQGNRVAEAFRRVEALGARWGLQSEEAFREGMRKVLEERFGARVERWEGFDSEGIVFGHPAPVELDVVVRDGGTLLIEVKSHVSRGDLAAFERKARLYEQKTGTRAARMVVSPSVEPRAFQLAEDFGIEVSTSLA